MAAGCRDTLVNLLHRHIIESARCFADDRNPVAALSDGRKRVMQPNLGENLKNTVGRKFIDVESYVTKFGDQIQKPWWRESSTKLESRLRATLLVSVRRLCLVAFLITGSTWPTVAQTPQTRSQQTAGAAESQTLRLSPEAAQVADEIGVAQLVDQLNSKRPAGSEMSLESLALRHEIMEKVLAASLDVDNVNAVIDYELDQIRGIRADIQAKRDKAQNIINIASIFTGGVAGTITSAMQFKPSTVNLGNGIGAGGGAGSVGRQPEAVEAIPSVYPEAIWSYLNSPTPSQPNAGTRREQLIAKWRSEGRIQQDQSPKSERKIESVSGNIAQTRRLSISELNDRVAMLLDVRVRVSLMKRGLSEILRALSAAKSNQ
jgi:hypothetical protein